MTNWYLLHKALKFAGLAHQGQTRKGKDQLPYLFHPAIVGMILSKLGYDDDTIATGILHDLLEDTLTPKDEIKREFGENTLNLIEQLSEKKDPSMRREEKKMTWKNRKKEKMNKLKKADQRVRAISAIDLLCNLMELKDLIEKEGIESSKYFNVDLSKKIAFCYEELNIYKMNGDCSYKKIIPAIEEILNEIKGIVKSWQEND